ncbi:TetR-like C-terminal domain-containing protein [Streptomyces aurantiogriseus]
MTAQLQRQTDWLNQPASASIMATVVERAERDENARRIREDVVSRVDQHFTDALSAAARRGELRPGAQVHARQLMARIVGPLFFRRSMLGERLDKDTVAGEVDSALAPWLPNARQSGRRPSPGSPSGTPTPGYRRSPAPVRPRPDRPDTAE